MSDEKLRKAERSAVSPEEVERLEAERRRAGHVTRLDGKITKEVAIALGERGYGPIYSLLHKRKSGLPVELRVNGKCQVWKTRPSEWRLPCKEGFKGHYQLRESSAHEFSTNNPEGSFLPSVKTLRRLFRPEDQKDAAKLRRLLDGRLDPEKILLDGHDCSGHRPERGLERIMDAANVLLNGHGNEALNCPGHHGYFYQNSHASYVNMGDPYVLTLVLDHETGRFHVTSWGDYLEREESKSECWKESS